MKRILAAICYLLLAAWIAFDPFSKTPSQPDPVGKVFQFVCAALTLGCGLAYLRKRTDDKPNW